MRYIFTLIIGFFVCFSSLAAHLPIELFSKDAQFTNVQISPNGSYISAVTKQTPGKEGKNTLIILERESLKPTYVVHFPGNAQVGQYQWSSDSRVVVSKEYIKGWQNHPISHGEIYAVNADGSKPQYVVGYIPEQQTGTHLKKRKALRATSHLFDPLINDDKHILITTIPWNNQKEPHINGAKHILAKTTPWNNQEEPYIDVYKVNTFNGYRKKITRAPARMANYLTDAQGNVRIAVSSTDYINQELYIRDLKSGKWKLNQSFEKTFSNLTPQAFDLSGEYLFVTASKQGEPEGLYKINLKTGESTLVSQHNTVSPSNIWIDNSSKEIFAIEYEAGLPSYEFVEPQSMMSQRLKSLLASLTGQQVRIVSSSSNNDLSIVLAFSDTNSGDYYLYDAKANKMRYLVSANQDLDPALMSQVKPISYTARDGLTIHGYLTVPNGKEAKNLPLVVLPHGGPHGPRDWWSFDPKTQLLANRGIAVLQMNFRGSGGYGLAFEHAGHQKWGAEIQYDILDGVMHLIKEGTVDKNNICILGASFGGYSALQSAILSPDLFKCAIGVIGVYDLPLMFEEGDISDREAGQRYLSKVLGDDEAQLKAFSPSYNIDKLQSPVLIVHGGEDERTPIEQAESLIKALEMHKHPYEYLLLEDEGHGFYLPKHRQKYYEAMLAFLEKHLVL